MSVVWNKNGREIKVAWTEMVLFFNNDTIKYGMSVLGDAISVEKNMAYLIRAGFDEQFAGMFLDKMVEVGNIYITAGTVFFAGDEDD